MKICTACQNEQAEGNFCGKCGNPLEESAATTKGETVATSEAIPEPEKASANATAQQASPQTNEQIELLKIESKAYVNYFLEKLKIPSYESNFKNSLISIAIFLVLSAIGIFAYVKNMTSGYIALSFFSIFMSLVIFFTLMIFVSILSIFLTTSLGENKPPFKVIIKKYGNYFPTAVSLTIIGLILILVKSNNVGIFLISLGITIVITVIPLYLATKYIQTLSFKLDKFYMFLIFLAVQIILYIILFTVLADNLLGQIQSYFPYFYF